MTAILTNHTDLHDEDEPHAFYSAAITSDPAFLSTSGEVGSYVTTGGKWGVSSIMGTFGGTVTWSVVDAGWADVTPQVENFFEGTTVSFSNIVANFFSLITNAFNAWSAVANINFVNVADGGGNIGAGTNAHIRISAASIGGIFGSNTLGKAFFPAINTANATAQSGDIVINSDLNWTEGQFANTILHEIGHSIGLGHSDTTTSVMNAYANGVTTLQPDDIAGIVSIYGARNGPNQAPTISGPATYAVLSNVSLFFGSIIGADSDGAVVSYRFSDTTPGTDNGYLSLDGQRITGTSITLAAADRGRLSYFTGTISGTNTIEIVSIDDQGLESIVLSPTITVTAIIDDYTNNAGTTGVLVPGSAVTGNIEVANDQDWFRIELTAGLEYVLNLVGGAGSINTILTLYNSAGAIVTSNDNYNFPTDFNSQIRFTAATTGAYYLGAQGFGNSIGAYTLSSSAGAPPQFPEVTVLGNGISIIDGDSSPSTQDSTDFGVVSQNGGISRTFTVRNDGPGILTTTSFSLLGDFYITEVLSATIASGASDTFTVGMLSGTTGVKTGQVSFATNDSDESTFNFTISGTVVAPLQPDLTVSNLVVTQPSAPAGGTIGVSFTINNVGDGGAYTGNNNVFISTDSVITTADTLLYSGGSVYLDPSASSNQQYNTITMPSNLASSTYYIGVITDPYNVISESNNSNNASNAVTITVAAVADDYSNTTSTSGVISSGGSATGNIETVGDQDWFRIQLTAGVTYTFNLNRIALSDPFLRLYDTAGNFISSNDDFGGLNSQITYTANSTGTYYLGASGYSSSVGTYTLLASGVAASLPEVTVLGNGVVILDGDTSPSSADGTDFGTVSFNGSITRTFTIRNDGTASLSLSPSFTMPQEFIFLKLPPPTLAPGASDTFTVSFRAMLGTTAGVKTAEVSFTTNDGDESPFNFAITGTVSLPQSPEITVLGNGVVILDGDTTPSTEDGTDFGTISYGSQPVLRTFTVRNDGVAALTPSFLTLPAGIEVVEGLSGNIAAGGSDTFTVRCNTFFSTYGPWTNQITFTTNDPDEATFNFNISGNFAPPGQPDFAVTGLSLISTTLQSSGTTTASFNVNNLGSVSGYAGNVTMFLSTDNIITTSDTYLTNAGQLFVDASSSSLASLGFTLPSNVAPGTYYIGVIADSFGTIAEGNETNNVSNTVAISVLPPSLFTQNADTVSITFPGLIWNALDGDDIVTGTSGADTLNGDAGADMLDGGLGNDTIDGGAGNDLIHFDAYDTAANVKGGADFDTLFVNNSFNFAPSGFDLAAQGFEQAQHDEIDSAGAFTWGTRTTFYSNQWVKTLEVGVYDSGADNGDSYNCTWTNGILANLYFSDTGLNDKPYQNYTISYNPAGQQISVVGLYYNNGTYTTTFDNANEAWSSVTLNLNSTGQALYSNTSHDNGDNSVANYINGVLDSSTTYDTGADDQFYQYYTVNYNAAGVAFAVSGINNDGSPFSYLV